MGLFENGRTDMDGLVAREAVLHFDDGEASMRGFVKDVFTSPPAVLLMKPTLLIEGEAESALGGEALVFENRIKFIQLLGA